MPEQCEPSCNGAPMASLSVIANLHRIDSALYRLGRVIGPTSNPRVPRLIGATLKKARKSRVCGKNAISHTLLPYNNRSVCGAHAPALRALAGSGCCAPWHTLPTPFPLPSVALKENVMVDHYRRNVLILKANRQLVVMRRSLAPQNARK